MSLTLELLRSETDRESFYWPYSNGLISAVPHDCQRAKKADPPMVNNNNVTRNKVARNGLSPSDTRHSYCKYFLNVKSNSWGKCISLDFFELRNELIAVTNTNFLFYFYRQVLCQR